MTYDGYFVKNISVTVPTGFEIVGASFIDCLNSAVIGTVSFKEDGTIECKFLSRYAGNFTFKVRVLLKELAS